MMRYLSIVLFFCCASFAQSPAEWLKWNEPVKPFRIIGNIYYVGAANVSSFAIKTSKGIIVIDGGMPETAPLILDNLKTLSFDPKDVKILLNSHAHADHAGGLAELKKASGAKVYASKEDKPLLENGGKNDFAWGDNSLFPPIKVDHTIASGEHVTLGDTRLTAIVTPGHTKGCTSWSMQTNEGNAEYHVVLECSLTVPGYKLVNNPKYPNIVDDYRRSFFTLKKQRADVMLAPHGDFFDLKGRSERLANGDPKAFVDPTALRKRIEQDEAAFNRELAKQRAAGK